MQHHNTSPEKTILKPWLKLRRASCTIETTRRVERLACPPIVERVVLLGAAEPHGTSMKSPISIDCTSDGSAASEVIDKKIAELGDWRGTTLSKLRELIKEAAPAAIEEVKWMGTPVWSLGGIICTGETYKSKVKLTFMKGASLADPAKLFNSSLDGKVRRAIDIQEGDAIDASAFKALIQAAVALNTSTVKAKPR